MFRDCVLAVLLSVVCSLLTAMPVAYGGEGYALEFDGVGDYVDVPTTDYIFEDEHVFTIELWARWFDDTRSLCSYRYSVERSRFRTRGSAALTVQTQIEDEGWHHVAAVYDGSGNTKYLDLYVDGVPTDSTTTTGSPLSTYDGNTLRFGMTRHSSGQYSNCIMDEVRIWNKGRAQSEIQEYMNLELFGGEEGLIGYWRFNEGEGTTVYDLSPYGNHGTIITATWTAEAAPVAPGQLPVFASRPVPAAGATDVPRDAVLSWTPGIYAPAINGHKVYISENFNDVNDGVGGIIQDANSYARPQRLDFNTTYYWRVDEVNAPPTSTVYRGSLWSFTTEPVAYAIENVTATASSTHLADMGPENTTNGSGLDANDLHSIVETDMWLSGSEPNAWIEYELDKVHKLHEMWVWNSNQVVEPMFGLGCKDVSIEYSVNGTDYMTLAGVPEFAQASGASDYAHNTTVDLSGVTAKYVRLTANSNWGGILTQYGLSEVRFFSIPVQAREPSLDSGATNVDVDVTLGFRAGREAAEHNVYLSTDEQAVIDGNAPVTTVTETSFGPLSLDLGETYYWKVNEVNMAETPTTWQGEIWNFSTPEFFVVEDFEDYNDYPPDEIWSTWVDGYGVATNGSTVGYPAPDFLAGEHYVETTTVHGGKQAMPFFYDNTGAAAYSEGERTFAVPQNWTEAGVQTLVLYFLGDPNNAVEQMYAKLNGSKVVYVGDAADITQAWWHPWNIDLALFGVDLQSVTKLSIGLGDETGTTSGSSGKVLFDNIRLHRSVPGPPVGIWIEAEAADGITSPMEIYDDLTASGGKYIGTTDDVGNSSDSPPPDGIATYNFAVQGGTYKVSCRIIIPSGDSFWVRIPGATTQTTNHSSGWVRWSDPDDSDNWYWADVFSAEDDDETVLFTLPAGTHTLEIAYREDGALLDAIVISKID